MSETGGSIFAIDPSGLDGDDYDDYGKPIPPAYRAFAIEYVANGYDHRKAAESVGLSPDQGVRLKRIPGIVCYVRFLQDKYLSESIVTRSYLDAFLDKIEDMAMGQVEVPMVLSDGTSIRAKRFDGNLALGIYKERAKLHNVLPDESRTIHVKFSNNSELSREKLVEELSSRGLPTSVFLGELDEDGGDTLSGDQHDDFDLSETESVD